MDLMHEHRYPNIQQRIQNVHRIHRFAAMQRQGGQQLRYLDVLRLRQAVQQRMGEGGAAAKGNGEPRHDRVAIDADILSYTGGENDKPGVYVAASPITPENNYFEIDILDTGVAGCIAVGLAPFQYSLDRLPGQNPESVAYQCTDGKLLKAAHYGRPFGPKCNIGDKVGCGINFQQVKEDASFRYMVPVFFTRNGKEVDTVLAPMPPGGLFPAIGMQCEGEEVKLNLDARWQQSEVVLMSIDSCDEDWARLHDVRINGQLLEYTGRGKSIIDVGMAQSRYPLDTRHHYYEIEIVDPGESCYIAIGLARRDYPKHRHPGWNKGSIAYHADDGKIFIGSGVGDPFGPRCYKGDIMGCGILFPRDYSSEADSDGSHEFPENDEIPDDDYIDLEGYSEDSEDDEWWEESYSDNGPKVQVFFTRNGKTVGRKEVRIPKGGFYPTVGMLSSDEKVRIDLRPLTG